MHTEIAQLFIYQGEIDKMHPFTFFHFVLPLAQNHNTFLTTCLHLAAQGQFTQLKTSYLLIKASGNIF